MPKKRKYTIGTVLFLGILVISIIGAFPLVADQTIIWMIVGICGALVAIENIRRKEENSFLIGTTALLVIVIAMTTIPDFSITLSNELMNFLVNLAFAFGIAGFVVALGLITRLGLEK